MKHILFELIFLLAITAFLSGCKKDDPIDSSETLGTNPDNLTAFLLHGGPYDGLSINADSGMFGKAVLSHFESGSLGDVYTLNIGSFSIDGDTLIVELISYASRGASGTFTWQDRAKGSGNGFEIKFLKANNVIAKKTFRSTSGATRITRSGSGSNFIYKGEFAGTLADSLGTIYTVSNGKF